MVYKNELKKVYCFGKTTQSWSELVAQWVRASASDVGRAERP